MVNKILKTGDLPIVWLQLKQPIIGTLARLILMHHPWHIQYLCSSTAIAEREWGGNAHTNLKERVFLDVEWDDLPIIDQCRLLWYLQEERLAVNHYS